MEDEEEIKRRVGKALLRIAYLRGHIPKDVYLDRNALMRWWDSLDEPKKSEILEDCATYIEAENEWHKKKFSVAGWRAWLAGTIPAVFAIRWLVYAPGEQKWWAIAIFLGGALIMRWLINLYDNLRGNPRRVYGKIEGERREQSLFRIFDISLIVIGIALIIRTAIISNSMNIIGIILTAVGLLFLLFRTRYLKRNE